jgi:hypothetical protein
VIIPDGTGESATES